MAGETKRKDWITELKEMSQDELGAPVPERDQAHLVPTLIGVHQQPQDCALDLAHPGTGSHRTAGVDHEQHEVSFLAAPLSPPQIRGSEQDPATLATPVLLEKCRRREGGRQVDGPGLGLCRQRPDRPAATGPG